MNIFYKKANTSFNISLEYNDNYISQNTKGGSGKSNLF